MSETPPPRGYRPLDPNPFGGAAKRGAVVVYGLLAVGLAGLAAYMGVVEGRPLTSGYVAAPAIGALWFGLRLFMSLAPRR